MKGELQLALTGSHGWFNPVAAQGPQWCCLDHTTEASRCNGHGSLFPSSELVYQQTTCTRASDTGKPGKDTCIPFRPRETRASFPVPKNGAGFP